MIGDVKMVVVDGVRYRPEDAPERPGSRTSTPATAEGESTTQRGSGEGRPARSTRSRR